MKKPKRQESARERVLEIKKEFDARGFRYVLIASDGMVTRCTSDLAWAIGAMRLSMLGWERHHFKTNPPQIIDESQRKR